MKPDAPAPADLPNLLRQQLILAQVRIMELEDERDELAPRLAGVEKLLAAAQTLAEGKADESAHLDRVRADLQHQYEHMRHMQHVTNQALETARAELAAADTRNRSLLAEAGQLQALIRQQGETAREQQAKTDELSARLQATLAESAARLDRVNQLDAELRALKSSRSWRWTAWLRSIERALR